MVILADYQKKKLAKIFLPKKSQNREFQTQKKSCARPHHMKYGVTTWGYYSLAGHDLFPKKQVTLYVFQKNGNILHLK